ncbi:MAG TPA: hypothetical protein PLM25_02115 [Limnochordia bacterium]|mgnify:FL=1|nr:hypothetical protein [Limnochordia bacterium]
MRIRPGWKVTAAALIILLACLGTALASFALVGFPYRTQVPAQLMWGEALLLALLLALPLFR